MAASKLSINQAKVVMYWRLGTIRIVDPSTRSYPALGLIGPSGSGKSTIEGAVISVHPESCYTINCEGATPATTRDELARAIDKVAVIEEFDEVTDLKAASRFVQARCYRDTSDFAYKEPLEKGGYRDKVVHLWGATIYHMRNAPSDAALTSRSILIHTRHEDGPFPAFDIDTEVFREIYGAIDWNVTDTGVSASGRVFDTWKPVLRVACALGDTEWLEWAAIQVGLLQERLHGAAEYDYRQAILARIVEILASDPMLTKDAEDWGRIAIDAQIGTPLRQDLFPRITPWEVTDTVKGLGFKTERVAGKRWLYPKKADLILACQENRYRDKWVSDLERSYQLPMQVMQDN